MEIVVDLELVVDDVTVVLEDVRVNALIATLILKRQCYGKRKYNVKEPCEVIRVVPARGKKYSIQVYQVKDRS